MMINHDDRQIVMDEYSNIQMPVPPLKIDAKNYQSIVIPFNIKSNLLNNKPSYEYKFFIQNKTEEEDYDNYNKDFSFVQACYLIQSTCTITTNTFPVDLGLKIYGKNINTNENNFTEKVEIDGIYMDQSGGKKKIFFALICHAKTTPSNQNILRDKSHYFGKVFHKWGGVTKKDIIDNIATLPGRKEMTVIKYPHVIIYFLHINSQEWLHADSLEEFVHMRNEETDEPDLYAFPTCVVKRAQNYLFDLLKEFKPIDLSKVRIELHPSDGVDEFEFSSCFQISLLDQDDLNISKKYKQNILQSMYQISGFIELTVLPQERIIY
jgi:hypothetical protein